MTLKMVFAPLTFAGLAGLFVYTGAHFPCAVMLLAKIASNISI